MPSDKGHDMHDHAKKQLLITIYDISPNTNIVLHVPLRVPLNGAHICVSRLLSCAQGHSIDLVHIFCVLSS